jgi:hypothetical protein
MQIGKPLRTILVEPLELPLAEQNEELDPEPESLVAEVEVPVGQ